ncbi:MAG: hypothetical protein DBX58_03805 [Clostridiales bacterium]|nr:MAG: hypothetical protein DBX58_03805 [Clostridiales bacterium]
MIFMLFGKVFRFFDCENGRENSRQHPTFRASAHPQRSVFFYTIGNEISYRIKKAASDSRNPLRY